LIPLAASVAADMRSPGERRQPRAGAPGWAFDGMLYVLVALQFTNVFFVCRMFAEGGLLRADTLVAVVLVGVNSGYSAIVVAHELIHRSAAHMKLLGRALLCTVLYEHFFTEHVRGHHARVGTADDPATARFGERFGAFFRRTVPAQLRSAWALEAARLEKETAPTLRRRSPAGRWARNRVVQGLVVEWSLALAILAWFGPAAFAIFVAQAFVAVSALEAVNYFEHWGLVRSSRRVRPVDSWDTDSAFTLYTLVGLSRHADHHAYAARPYHQLRHWDESPKLPYGYFGMVFLIWTRDDLVVRMLTRELRSRRLGPFARAEEPARAAAPPFLGVVPFPTVGLQRASL
jgi:alkane 1-monooxygenase